MKKLLAMVVLASFLLAAPTYASSSKQARFNELQGQMDLLQVNFYELAQLTKAKPEDSTLRWRLVFTEVEFDKVSKELDVLKNELADSLVFNQRN